MNTTSIHPTSGARHLAQSMLALQTRFEAISSNLANVSTPGHKRLVTADNRFAHQLAQASGATSLQVSQGRDFGAGDLVDTGNRHDLSLRGDGFFAVELGGETFYTRFASWRADSEGFLQDQRGARLLGEAGPIQVGVDANVNVLPEGDVQADGQNVGRLQRVQVDPTQLYDAGPGLFRTRSGAQLETADGTTVHMGYREQSNVDPTQEMVALITLQRQYQATQRALRLESDLHTRLAQALR